VGSEVAYSTVSRRSEMVVLLPPVISLIDGMYVR